MDLSLGCNVAQIKQLVPKVPPIMGLHGAKEASNHGYKGGEGGRCGYHKVMAPYKIGANGVHNGPTNLLEAP